MLGGGKKVDCDEQSDTLKRQLIEGVADMVKASCGIGDVHQANGLLGGEQYHSVKATSPCNLYLPCFLVMNAAVVQPYA